MLEEKASQAAAEAKRFRLQEEDEDVAEEATCTNFETIKMES